jgi:NADPH:quinone reductase
VLIAVHPAGVGGWDADIRDGWSPGGPIRFPLVLGTDGSGTIAQLGKRVRRFKTDNRVYSYSWNNPKGVSYGWLSKTRSRSQFRRGLMYLGLRPTSVICPS